MSHSFAQAEAIRSSLPMHAVYRIADKLQSESVKQRSGILGLPTAAQLVGCASPARLKSEKKNGDEADPEPDEKGVLQN